MKEIKNAWWDYVSILSSQVASFPLGILYISFVTRKLGPENWGILTIFMSIIQLAFCLAINWTSASIVRFGKEEFLENGHMRQTVWARSAIVFTILLIFSFLIFILKGPLANYIGLPEQAFLLILPMLLAYSLYDFLTWILKAMGLMKQFALSLVLRQAALILLLIPLIFMAFSLNVQNVMSIEILSYFFICVFCIFFLKLSYFFPLEKRGGKVKNILVYSWPMIFTFIFGYTTNWMDVYFIKYFLSNYHVGVYQAAYRMMSYINTPLMSVITLLFPMLMAVKIQGRSELIQTYIKNLIPQFSLFWNIIVSVLIVFSGPIVKIVFGNSFSGAALSFMVLLLGVGFQAVTVMYTSVFLIFDWLKYVTFIALAMSVVNFTGDMILVPRIGILGAAISTVISYILSSVLYLTFANRLVSVRTHKALFYPLLSVVSFLFCLGVSSISLRVMFAAFNIAAFLYIAKINKLFSPADIALFEKIEMPRLLRSGIRRVYSVLC